MLWMHGIMVKDESDLIVDAVGFHKARGAAVAVLDNGSTDGSLEALRELRDAGELALLYERPVKFNDQTLRNAFAARLIRKFEPTWLSVGDLDERWLVNVDELRNCTDDGLYIDLRYWWPSRPGEPLDEMSISSSHGDLFYQKVGRRLSKVIVRADSLWWFVCGGHLAEIDGEMGNARRSLIAHFPFRNFEQLQKRVEKWQAVAAYSPRMLSRTTRRLVDLADQGKLTPEWFESRCCAMAARRYKTAAEFYEGLQGGD